MKIIIFGATEVGCLLATEFFEDHDITIIDKEENRTEQFDKLDISFVQGNASDIDVLKCADIKNTDIFIACTPMDEVNIVACLAAKRYGKVRTICFVSKEEYKNTLTYEKNDDYFKNQQKSNLAIPPVRTKILCELKNYSVKIESISKKYCRKIVVDNKIRTKLYKIYKKITKK